MRMVVHAEMHIASAYGKDMNRRIEAISFEDNEKIGIAHAFLQKPGTFRG